MKFSEKKVAAIRTDVAKVGVRAAARKHGCSAMYASQVARGLKRWSPLPIFSGHFEAEGCQLWRHPFWYGDGKPATIPCVVLTLKDFRKLTKSRGGA